jgi:hypothetical protein
VTERRITPEILDSLPSDHPDAVSARRELRGLNGLMGNFRWISRVIRRELPVDGEVLEIGAGDGALGLKLMAQIPGLEKRLTGLDRVTRPTAWPDAARWIEGDLWSAEGESAVRRATVVIANLVLHHFPNADLERLGSQFDAARLVVINEPARREFHCWQGKLIAPFLNHVTRHDLPVSVRAGFIGHELSRFLALDSPRWECRHTTTFFGAYRLAARRSNPRE